MDYANRVTELRQSHWGSVLEFEGQEGLHGHLPDDVILRGLLRDLRGLPFANAQNLDENAIMNQTGGHFYDFRRNTAHHVRYLLMEPGHWRRRPDQESPYTNLTFAGDWMKGTQPTASMEAAVRTGRVAANLVRARAGLPSVTA
jgi:hypothetical protein